MQHAPGVPKVLVGNRLHLAFRRQVGERDAEAYAAKNRMAFFEVSPLCDFNIRESFSELSRMALHRNGMERLLRPNKGKTRWQRPIRSSTQRAQFVNAISLVYSAQPARTGVSRDSSPHDGLWYRPATVAHVHQVASKIVRNNDHISIALQRQSFIELQQEFRIASPETAIRRGSP